MYTMLRELNTEEVNLVTLEDPVEYHVEGINQVQINDKTGMTFAGGLRAILRQDPDIIAVGEVRDGETAEIAMRAALTGHLVLSTIHTNNAVAAIDRLMDMGVEPYLISGALRGVVSQRLVRRICPNCRKAYAPSPEERLAFGLPPQGEELLYHGEGCPSCYYTGFRGRIGAFEILMLDAQLRRSLQAGELSEEVAKRGQKNFISMAESCRHLVLRGVTTVEEARRAMNSSE